MLVCKHVTNFCRLVCHATACTPDQSRLAGLTCQEARYLDRNVGWMQHCLSSQLHVVSGLLVPSTSVACIGACMARCCMLVDQILVTNSTANVIQVSQSRKYICKLEHCKSTRAPSSILRPCSNVSCSSLTHRVKETGLCCHTVVLSSHCCVVVTLLCCCYTVVLPHCSQHSTESRNSQ